MRLLPVLDLLRGKVVRGVGGRRSDYRPIVSRWTDSTEPVAVAQALRRAFGSNELYVADLDAIQGGAPQTDAIRSLCAADFRLEVDAGIRSLGDALPAARDGIDIVAGLETLESPEGLADIVRAIGADRVVFSLDSKGGRPLAGPAWPTAPKAIAEAALRTGIRRLLVLDLERVGVGEGVGTEDFCRQVRSERPEIELSAGGGVRGVEDLERLREIGVDAVLVASALHDGRLGPEDVQRFSSRGKRAPSEK